MIYPRFIKANSTIGITAPSDGNRKETDFIRLDNGCKRLKNMGYKIMETSNVRSSVKGRSSDGKTRAKELEDLFLHEDVDLIVSAKGGDFLMEMLPYVDLDMIKNNPTWFQGYSDNTGLTFTITTNLDIATIYGNNFNDFGMEVWHDSISNNISLLEGKEVIQHSFDLYEDGFYDKVTGLEGYTLSQAVNWRNLKGGSIIELSGRMIGGCLDVLLNLVGTDFDKTKKFVDKYKDDGIIWYLESFSLDSAALMRGLWQLKEAGWFNYVKGFVFGRPAFYKDDYDISYDEAVLSVLEVYNVPIILDADIGHKAPQMTIMNGAIGNIYSSEGKGSIIFKLR